ncbi:hypothetical protein J8273_2967 [Carpediemonas membranifera]|uniref:Uncharacterized protein n=1 Tax=Carpediemonas membranifera TaxID=201153 RepID=A0A8J6AZU8_9EUKA|nr:hypothetical protein J8273_2967 [Carpediemonas membranifera]|eukprot:KAG9395400.1 hypothetical protein J8273_2967 [Carpediemonas membranifera]
MQPSPLEALQASADILHSIYGNFGEEITHAMNIIDRTLAEAKNSTEHSRTPSEDLLRQKIIDEDSASTISQQDALTEEDLGVPSEPHHSPFASKRPADLRKIAASRITRRPAPLPHSPSLSSFSALSATPTDLTTTPMTSSTFAGNYIPPVSVEEVRSLPSYMSGAASASELNRVILRMNQGTVDPTKAVNKAMHDPKRTPKVISVLRRLGRIEDGEA